MLKKRIFSLILILALVSSLLLGASSFALAENKSAASQKEALHYIKNLEGKSVCVENGLYDSTAVVRAYFRDIGGKPITSILYFCGNPYAYSFALSTSDGLVPSGWKRCYTSDGYIPKPGDVAVWDANKGIAKEEGFVALVTEVSQTGNSYQIKYLSQPNQTAVINTEFLRVV